MVQELQTSIFYVDDDQDDLDLFMIAAKPFDERVSLFSIPDEMLMAMKNPPPSPSIIFLDLNMPLKDGYVLLQEIRSMEIFSKTPVIMLSTADNSEVIRRCWNLGADLYVTKPKSIRSLKKAIESILDIDWETRIRSTDNFYLAV